MAEVFSAEVTVSIAKYAAEIAKIEGETGKSATKAAAALVTKLTAGQKAAAAAGVAAAQDAADAWGASIALQAAVFNKSIDAAKRDEAAWESARAAEVAALNAVIDAQEEATRAAAARTTATSALTDIAVRGGSAEEQLTRAYTKQRAEIVALAKVSGDASAASKALHAAHVQHTRALDGLIAKQIQEEATTGRVTKTTDGAKASYGNLANQLADIGKGIAAGQSPITVLIQQSEQLVFAVMQAVPATGALVAGIAAISVPAVALAGTFTLVAAAVLDYAEANAEAKRQSDALAAALTPLNEAIDEQQKQHELLNAALESDAPAKYLKIAEISADADRKEADATKALREEKAALMQSLADSNNMENFAGQIAQNRIKDIDEQIGLVHEQANEYARLAVTNMTLTEAIGGAEKATKKQTKAVKEQQAAVESLEPTLAEVMASWAEYDAMVTAAQTHVAARWDIVRAAAKTAGEEMRAETAAAQADIVERGSADQAAIVATLAAQQNATASLFGSTADAFLLASTSIDGLSKKQAMTLFRVTQAAQIAQALILAPAAILQGLAQAGPAGGIAAGIAAGVQVAAIAAAEPPSFRQGTPGYAPPVGEQRITADVGAGEGIAVVSRQGMANSRSEGVAAVNAGLGGGGGTTVVNMVLDGTILGTWIAAGAKTRRGKQAIQGAMSSSFRNPYRSI